MANRDDSRDSRFKLELRLTDFICEVVDSPRALTVSMLAKAGEWKQLAGMSIDPGQYQDVGNFADDYLVTEVLRKSSCMPTGIDTKQVAIHGFLEAEDLCRETNRRLEKGGLKFPAWFEQARRLIRRVLPPLNEEILEDIVGRMRNGPGSTTSVTGYGSVPSDKYVQELHVTPKLLPMAKAIMGDLWSRICPRLVAVRGNNFGTVSKDATKDRGICTEPGLNVFGQLGIGSFIRSRLRIVLGVDLDDQTFNQWLASVAQELGLATVDLSMASDTLAWKVVELLLPTDWLHLLELFRSPQTFINDEWVELEKFSSMGNGYTFELESLVFSAVVGSIVGRDDEWNCNVYGDDLVVPQKYAEPVIDALNFLGFKVNRRKTFLAGRFFESCGTDWFDGCNVRPFYCRRDREEAGKHGEIPYALQLANRLRIYSWERNLRLGCDERFQPIWHWLKHLVPKEWKLPVPLELGDVGLTTSFEEFNGPTTCKGGWEGMFVPTVRFAPVKVAKSNYGVNLAAYARNQHTVSFKGLALFAGDSLPRTYGREPVRGLFGKLVTKKCYVFPHTWQSDFGWTTSLR